MKKTVKGDGSAHHNTVGNFFGFGWMAKYGLRGDFSYARVAMKKGKTLCDLKRLFTQFYIDLNCMTNMLNDIIPGVVEKGQCIANELKVLSQFFGKKSSERIKSFSKGMILGMVCHNAQTGKFHVEKDCSFTLVGIPFGADGINGNGMFVFEFVWGIDKFIRIIFNPGTVIYYNGYAIIHRQVELGDQSQSEKDFKFWNLATYTNKSFYQKAMASFSRKQQHNNTKS